MKKIIVMLIAVITLVTAGCRAITKGETKLNFDGGSVLTAAINSCYGACNPNPVFAPSNGLTGFWIGAGPNATVIMIGRYGNIFRTTVI